MYINKLDTIDDLKELFQWLNEPIFRYVYVRCGYNREIAEDLAQEIFIKAWEKRSLFKDDKSKLKSWIYIIARNHIIDFYRKEKRVASYIDDISELTQEENITEDEELLFEDLIRSLDDLKEEEKDVLTLKYIQELEISEVASIINKSKDATKVMIHRTIKKLKIIVGSKNE